MSIIRDTAASAYGLLLIGLLAYPKAIAVTLAAALLLPATCGIFPLLTPAGWLLDRAKDCDARGVAALERVTFAGVILAIGIPGFAYALTVAP